MRGRLTTTMLLLAVIGIVALPWGIPHSLRFALPLLPTALVYAISIGRPGAVTALIAFATGLIMDVITHGPLGYWALLFVIAHAGGSTLGRLLARRRLGGAWLGFAITTVVTAAAGWGGASLIDLSPADPLPLALATLVILPGYPALAALARAAGSDPTEAAMDPAGASEGWPR